MTYKEDYPPLLGPGHHTMSLSQLKHLCVSRFPDSIKRKNLYYKLEELVQELLIGKINCQIWIDGSFLTEKPDPRDLDIIIILDLDFSEILDVNQNLLIDKINSGEYIPGLDSWVTTCFPRGHELFDEQSADINRWARQYNVENSDFWLKGVAVLRLGENDVGLRFFT